MNDFKTPDGTTPLDPDEAQALLLAHITTRGELDRWEQQNINEAMEWLSRRRKKEVLAESFIKKLHEKMFGKVWKWAGRFRRSNKNIGAHWPLIPEELKNLFDDVRYWIEHEIYPEEEIAARFHHRLVKIHPFSNGNGRHARLATDVLMIEVFGKDPFSWSRGEDVITDEIREFYIKALRDADQGDYKALLEFLK